MDSNGNSATRETPKILALESHVDFFNDGTNARVIHVLRSTFLDTCDQFVNKRHALVVIQKSRRPLVLAIPAPLP